MVVKLIANGCDLVADIVVAPLLRLDEEVLNALNGGKVESGRVEALEVGDALKGVSDEARKIGVIKK